MEERKLAILLTRGPDRDEARWASALARAAAGRGAEVDVFLMGDGAEVLRTPEFAETLNPGVRISACTRTVISRGLPTDAAAVDYASQFQLAGIVARADRLVSL